MQCRLHKTKIKIMAELYIYQQRFIDQLYHEVSENTGLDRYLQNGAFSRLKVHKLIGATIDDNLCEKMIALFNKENELNAAIALYEGLKGVNRQIASDRRFWVYLAHNELLDYVRQRWPLNGNMNSSYILDHWFFKRSSMMRHALANLWWSVEMTFDRSHKEDPYWLTKVLFSNTVELRTRFYGSSLFLRNKEAAIGILTYMASSDTYKSHNEARSLFVYRYFNSLGGYLQLSLLNRDFFKKKMEYIEEAVSKIKDRSEVFKNPRLFDCLEKVADVYSESLPEEIPNVWSAFKNTEHHKNFLQQLKTGLDDVGAERMLKALKGKVAHLSEGSFDSELSRINSIPDLRKRLAEILKVQKVEKYYDVFENFIAYIQLYYKNHGTLDIVRTKKAKTQKIFKIEYQTGQEEQLDWKLAIVKVFESLGEEYLATRIRISKTLSGFHYGDVSNLNKEAYSDLPFGWHLYMKVSEKSIIKECNIIAGGRIKISRYD